jgi:N utilization substance protein A
MNAEEVLRLATALEREKGIDRGIVFESLEGAIAAALKRQLGARDEDLSVSIDRTTGDIQAREGAEAIDLSSIMGRIAIQSIRQTFMQRIREAESDTAFHELAGREGDIVTCTHLRTEGREVVCRVGERAEARIPRRDQVPGESFRTGDRFRALITEVEKKGPRLRIGLSRSREEFVRKLFALEVPELRDGTVVIKAIAREPGYRTKITVASNNDRVDCLGACVGVRGSRIRNVVDELNGENIDIIRYNEDPVELIKNALKPAEIAHVDLDRAERHATVWVTKEHLSQAIGRGGRNVRLAAKLTGWEIDIYDISEVANEANQAPPAAPTPAPEPTPPETQPTP